MKLELTVEALPAFPHLEGAHALSWSYLLDHIFADACATELEALTFVLPSPELVEEVELRNQLSLSPRGARGHGAALLGGEAGRVAACERLYRLEFGVLAPAGLRRAARTKPEQIWRPAHRLSVLSLEARLWGLPIRLAHLLRRPELHDRALFKMRQRFARERTPAYYQLTTYALATTPLGSGGAV